MFKTLFLIFLFYMLYKLVFDFIIPVYNASKRMKDQVGQMQQKMREEQERQQFQRNGYVQQEADQTASKKIEKDYIDYEEIKGQD
ncbi:MAG: hypothetical protein EOO13_17885 [Chitinophagaceae bacterium]|nr:MAG: hypothetical protein EOO13_17885 [Chitinophagaceae bacterium]